MDKVNHAYAYGGIPLTKKTLEEFLGIQIDYYAETDFSGFIDIINHLGGITIYVEKDIKGTGIQKSLQKLDGKSALAYVRDRRDPLGDISRVRRQQKFLQALAAEILNYEHKWKLSPELARLYGNLETDISLEEMCGTYAILREADLEHIRMELVPGSFYNHRGISYWKPDQNKTDLIVSSIFRQAGQGHKTQSSTP